ncbi:MAG: carbonic anhydrase, partial [Proteobacteria bacterium]|nr:carbonic anhydrase [Pseudomonadota bacterium]
RAYLDGLYAATAKPTFIDRWMTLLHPARADALQDIAGAPIEARQQALEFASVKHSIGNLKTFPFIRERIEDGRLRLRGAYFDIADGRLLALDPEDGTFGPLT